jgi:hypothetical protein
MAIKFEVLAGDNVFAQKHRSRIAYATQKARNLSGSIRVKPP